MPSCEEAQGTVNVYEMSLKTVALKSKIILLVPGDKGSVTLFEPIQKAKTNKKNKLVPKGDEFAGNVFRNPCCGTSG